MCHYELTKVRFTLEKQTKGQWNTGINASVPPHVGKKAVFRVLNLLRQKPRNLLRNVKVSTPVKNSLWLRYIIKQNTDRNTSSQNPTEIQRKAISHCITGSILIRYKLQRYPKTTFRRRHSHANPKHDNNRAEIK